MVEIKEINWLSLPANEAEVTLTDGINDLICFSQPFQYKSHDKIVLPLHTLNANNIRKQNATVSYAISRINFSFEYYLQGKVINKHQRLVQVGGFFIELDSEFSADFSTNDIVSFSCDRIDIYN